MNVMVDDAIVVAVSGLVIKEVAVFAMKLRSRRGGNGNGRRGSSYNDLAPMKGTLEDIKGQGKLTLEKIGFIEKEQGEIKTNVAVLASEVTNFKDKCVLLDGQLKQVEERVFDHIRNGG
jgi:hypothetical protein